MHVSDKCWVSISLKASLIEGSLSNVGVEAQKESKSLS